MSFFMSDSLKNKISEEDLIEEYEQKSGDFLAISLGEVQYKIKKFDYLLDSVKIKLKLEDTQARFFFNEVYKSKIILNMFGKTNVINNESVKIKSIIRNEKENLFTFQILISELGDNNV